MKGKKRSLINKIVERLHGHAVISKFRKKGNLIQNDMFRYWCNAVVLLDFLLTIFRHNEIRIIQIEESVLSLT